MRDPLARMVWVEILVLLEGALRPGRVQMPFKALVLKSLFCWRGHCDPPLFAPHIVAVMLKSLFCWRGHCDLVSARPEPALPVEILVLLEGALRPTLFSLRWPLGRGTPLRSRQRSREPQAHIISIRVPSSLRYPHFTGSAPTRGFQIAPSLRLLKSLFCWRGHCDGTLTGR